MEKKKEEKSTLEEWLQVQDDKVYITTIGQHMEERPWPHNSGVSTKGGDK
jgi:hypothetical protein